VCHEISKRLIKGGAGKKKGVVRAGEIGDSSVNRDVRVERESA